MQKIKELESQLQIAKSRIEILESENSELTRNMTAFAWSQDDEGVDDKWLTRTTDSESKPSSDTAGEAQSATRKKSKSVIDDTILQNLRIFKEDIQLTNMVGKGSFGVVWKANFVDQVVAVKVFVSKDIDVNREVNTMAKATGQSHVLDLIGVVLEEEDQYKPPQIALVMKFMANGSLQDICYRSAHSLPSATKIKFCYQAAKGVKNLHSMNIIHRDLACRNLLVDDRMDVFVADFGFARLKQLTSSKDQTLTRVGPVRWEAPEALEFKVYSEKTDSFSFGVCIYEITTGCEPWSRCATSAAVILNVLKGKRMMFPINCDPVLVDMALQCWSHSPEARPDFTTIVDKLGRRLQEVDEDNREVQYEIRTVESMISGANVLKYPFVVKEGGRGRKPQQRFVRLTSDLKSLLWRSSTANTVFSSARSKAIERGVNMSDVTEVLEGQATENFRLFPSSNNHHAHSLCFSLRTGDRTVDIQCETTHDRNQWVWGLRFLLSRLKPSPRLQEVRLRSEEFTCIDTEQDFAEHMNAMRYVAYWLKRGEIMIKYTSRKTHARHVSLSNDMTEILWSSETDGPVRKGRSKSISLNDIHNIVLGVQPRLMTSSAKVAAAASQLSDKLTFFRHQTPSSLTSVNLERHSTSHGRGGSVDTEDSNFVRKAPKPASSKRDHKERRNSITRSIGSIDELMRPMSMASLPPMPPVMKRKVSEDTHSSAGSTLGSSAYHDESDFQLCVSYIGIDGRTLLALRCPNDEVLKLWSDGLAKLMAAVRKSREETEPHYNSASDFNISNSPEHGGKWLKMKEHGVVVTPPPDQHSGVSRQTRDDDDACSVDSAITVNITDTEPSGNTPLEKELHAHEDQRKSLERMDTSRFGAGQMESGLDDGGYVAMGSVRVEPLKNEYVAMQTSKSERNVTFSESKESELFSSVPLISADSRRHTDGGNLDLTLSLEERDEINAVREGLQIQHAKSSELSPYVSMPGSQLPMAKQMSGKS